MSKQVTQTYVQEARYDTETPRKKTTPKILTSVRGIHVHNIMEVTTQKTYIS